MTEISRDGKAGGVLPPTTVTLRSWSSGRDSLKRRVVSALVLLPIVIVPSVMGGVWFAALMALVALLMTREWHRMTGGRPSRGLFRGEVCVSFAAIALAMLGHVPFAFGAVVLGALLAHAIAAAEHRPLPWPGLGVLYVGLPCVALVWLRDVPDVGLGAIAWLMGVVWATDVFAYAAGRGIGGPKLAPRFSPKKTWAGLLGGMLGAGVVSILVNRGLDLGWSDASVAVIGAATAVLSQVGDIGESMLKRRFGVKDSGRLIPGHGGILDRVDGIVPAALAVSLAVWLGA